MHFNDVHGVGEMSHYLAEAEMLGEPELVDAIKRAEAEHEITTGMRFSPSGSHLVTVTFHPGVKFWIEDFVGIQSKANRRLLTRAEYDQTHGLRL